MEQVFKSSQTRFDGMAINPQETFDGPVNGCRRHDGQRHACELLGKQYVRTDELPVSLSGRRLRCSVLCVAALCGERRVISSSMAWRAAGVNFIRNGNDYDGVAAAKNLQMKVNYVGERVKTAEEFVRYCASESSMTHQKYKIQLPDGKTIDAATYFTGKLHELDEKH